MSIVQCVKGHFYDSTKNESCPYCNGEGGAIGISEPIKVNTQRSIEPSGIASGPLYKEDEQKTVALIKNNIGIDPVVGWLVCIEGVDKGKDYRIRAQRNFIGRGESMDICVRGDQTISRDGHAVISYNERKSSFTLAPGNSKGITYVNDEEVLMGVTLKAYDVIEIGNTKLLFVPLCGEHFKWV